LPLQVSGSATFAPAVSKKRRSFLKGAGRPAATKDKSTFVEKAGEKKTLAVRGTGRVEGGLEEEGPKGQRGK